MLKPYSIGAIIKINDVTGFCFLILCVCKTFIRKREDVGPHITVAGYLSRGNKEREINKKRELKRIM